MPRGVETVLTENEVKNMYAIIGITGNVGGEAACQVLAAGKQVRGLVRNSAKADPWRKKGAEVVVGNLSDPVALEQTFKGVEAAFLMTPTYFETSDMFAENTRDLAALKSAIVGAGVPRVVLLSSVGGHRSEGTGAIMKLHEMEQAFFGLPIACASVRAAWFMENFAGMIGGIGDSGIFHSLLNPLDRPIPMVATRDIAALVADLLQQHWTGRRVIELAGPRPYAPMDVAKAFSSVLHRDVRAEVLPRTQWMPLYQSWGLTPKSAQAMADMLDGFNRGWIQFQDDGAERRHGETTLEAFLGSVAGAVG
jgi:NAD(P)H dehydrogenase (quinone)